MALFGALVLANGMCTAANSLKHKLHIQYGASLALVVLAAAATIGGVLWFFGSTIVEQIGELEQRIPEGARWIRQQLDARPYVRDLASNFDFADLSGPTGWFAASLVPKVKSFGSIAGSLVISAIVSIYLSAQPKRYVSGLLLLVPPASRHRAQELFDAVSVRLARWLLGQFAVMATVGILSGFGLWLLGVRAAFVLGFVGGSLSFVPFFGSILAALLAALFALGQGPTHALAVLMMYVVVHFVEGNFITPIIQSEATSLPPALALVSVLSWTILLGAPAAFLAVPLTLVMLTAVDVLYVEPMTKPAAS